MPHEREDLPDSTGIDPADVVPPVGASTAGPLDEFLPKDKQNPGFIDLADVPGSRRALEIEKEDARQTALEVFTTNVAPVAKDVIRLVEDEGVIGLFGVRKKGTAYDKRAASEALANSGLNREQAWAALEEPNLEAHTRAVKRMQDENERARVAGLQSPGGQFGRLAAGFLDVDAPLILLSGGGAGSAKLTRQALRIGKEAGVRPRIATRMASGAVGVSAGIQAGAVIGVADMAARDVADWGDLATIMLASTAMGATLGTGFNLNRHLNQAAAEREFVTRYANDAPSAVDNLNVADLHRSADATTAFDVPEGAAVIGGEEPASLGAAAVPGSTSGRPARVLEDPAGPIGTPEKQVMDTADSWAHDSDFLTTRDAQAKEWWARVATNELGGFSTHNFHDLWKGQARVGNWIGGVIFESPSGLNRGRATSSALMEMFHRRIMKNMGGDFSSFSHRWAKDQNTTWRNTGHGISKDGKRAFSREVFLEMNDRRLGRASTRSEHVVGAADRMEASGKESFEILRGRAGQRAVDGFEDGGIDYKAGYLPYRADGFRINEMLRNGVKMKDIERAMANSYRQAGMDQAKDAEAVAKAVIARARTNEFSLDTSTDTLLSGDGREFLKESLRNSGMSEANVDGLMLRLMGDQAEKGKESFAKGRNELDMSARIDDNYQIVDLFDLDIDTTWQRYARQASGSAALARMGIANRAQRKTVIAALQAEQRALGEAVSETDLMNAMFSHFDAGPVWGFSGGQTNKGIGRVAATAKRLANLGLLEKLGITQLGEVGAIIAQTGVASFYRRSINSWMDKGLRQADKQLLDDLSFVTGEIGMDHRYYAEWRDLDDVGKQAEATLIEQLQQQVSDITSNASFVQNYLNLFNQVRAGQQKIAMMGMTDKVFRELRKGGIEGFRGRAERDLGLSIDDLEDLAGMLDDPRMIEWDASGKFINRVHFENWDPDLADVFGSALTRNMNQVVQKSMAGEQDAWMHSGWGSLMTHLLTFPIAAFQKQFLRNAQHMDLQAFSALSMGMLTATAAIHIRDVIDGREDTTAGRVKRGFNYNNMTSFVPMLIDPIASIMGQDDWRYNQFGPTADITPVVFSQLNNLRRLPGAVINAMTGADEFDYYDRQAMKATPYAGTYFLSRMFDK